MTRRTVTANNFLETMAVLGVAGMIALTACGMIAAAFTAENAKRLEATHADL